MWVTDEKGTRYVDDEQYAALVQARNDMLFDSINKSPGGQAALRAQAAERDAAAKAGGTVVDYSTGTVSSWTPSGVASAPQGTTPTPAPSLAPHTNETPLPTWWRPRGRVTSVTPRKSKWSTPLTSWKPR
jgi:hypothetical protein